jgi:hypothetical protein
MAYIAPHFDKNWSIKKCKDCNKHYYPRNGHAC